MTNLTCICLSVLLALSAAMPAPGPDEPAPEPEPAPPAVLYDDTDFVLHAGGVTPEGAAGTNSLEALDLSYARGYRTLELDFCWTADNELVCVHDWQAWYSEYPGVTLDLFRQINRRYGFQSLTLDTLADWMAAHPDVKIVTDAKERSTQAAELIARRYPGLRDQFIVQIYSTAEYQPVHDAGFDHIWITLYRMTWREKADPARVKDYLRGRQIEAVVFDWSLSEVKGYIKGMQSLGVPLYVHTINGLQAQNAVRAAGIRGIFTDYGDARIAEK